MKIRTVCLLVSAIFALGCGNISPHIPNSKAARSYSGTASVGDFLSITLDPAVHTFSYTNLSNGDVGNNIPYIVNPDGTYTLQDPQGNLVAAYEVPSFVCCCRQLKPGQPTTRPLSLPRSPRAAIFRLRAGQTRASTICNFGPPP